MRVLLMHKYRNWKCAAILLKSMIMTCKHHVLNRHIATKIEMSLLSHEFPKRKGTVLVDNVEIINKTSYMDIRNYKLM